MYLSQKEVFMSHLPQECYQNNLFYFYYKGEKHNLITSKIIATRRYGAKGSRHIYFYLKDQNIVVDFSFQHEFKGFLRDDPENGGFVKFDANQLFNHLSPISFLSYLKDYQNYVFEISKRVLERKDLDEMLNEYERALNYDASIRHSSCRPFFISYKELYEIVSTTD
jgi:hypothetical protein